MGFGVGGKRVRRKVSGRTKTEVKDKLQLLHDELRKGIRSSPRYTIQNAVDDWLAHWLDGRSSKTISTNREVLAPLTGLIGPRGSRNLRRPMLGQPWHSSPPAGPPGLFRWPTTAWSVPSVMPRRMIL